MLVFISKQYFYLKSIFENPNVLIWMIKRPFKIKIELNNALIQLQVTNNAFFSICKSAGFEYEVIEDINIQDGFLERTPYLRNFLKEISYALKKGGTVTIKYRLTKNYFSGGQIIRPISFFMHEFSISVSNVLELENISYQDKFAYIKIRKIHSSLVDNDSISNWSFGIISNGSPESIKKINSLIINISKLDIPNFEILICGPQKALISLATIKNVKIIPDDDLDSSIRHPITTKKNRLVKSAVYENLVLQHDRIFYSENWFLELKKHGNYFEIICSTLKAGDIEINNWLEVGDRFNYQNTFGKSLNKHAWSENIYINGALIIGKKNILDKTQQEERLKWGEIEDVHFSKKLFLNGFLIKRVPSLINYSHINRSYQVSRIKTYLTGLRVFFFTK